MQVARLPLSPTAPWRLRPATESILAAAESAAISGVSFDLLQTLRDTRETHDLRLSELKRVAATALAWLDEGYEALDTGAGDLAELLHLTMGALSEEVATASALRTSISHTAPVPEPIPRATTVEEALTLGDAFRTLFERELPIVLIAGRLPQPDEVVARLTAGIYEVIVHHGLQSKVSQLVGFTALGGNEPASEIAERIVGVERIGVYGSEVRPVGPPHGGVHKGMVFGEAVGDESWLIYEFARRGVMIYLGGSRYATDVALDLLRRDPGRLIVPDQFCIQVDRFRQLTRGLVDPALSAATDPLIAGRIIGQYICTHFGALRRPFWSDSLLSLPDRKHPETLPGALEAILENAERRRVQRLLLSACGNLQRAGLASPDVWREGARLAEGLATAVQAIVDPHEDVQANELWQANAREVVRAAWSDRYPTLSSSLDQAIYFASWFGTKRKSLS
jgi:hypothetical protein